MHNKLLTNRIEQVQFLFATQLSKWKEVMRCVSLEIRYLFIYSSRQFPLLFACWYEIFYKRDEKYANNRKLSYQRQIWQHRIQSSPYASNITNLSIAFNTHSNATWNEVVEGHLGESNLLWDALIVELSGIDHTFKLDAFGCILLYCILEWNFVFSTKNGSISESSKPNELWLQS